MPDRGTTQFSVKSLPLRYRLCALIVQGHEDPEEVRKQMERQWGTLTVEDTQETYRVDTVALEDRASNTRVTC